MDLGGGSKIGVRVVDILENSASVKELLFCGVAGLEAALCLSGSDHRKRHMKGAVCRSVTKVDT